MMALRFDRASPDQRAALRDFRKRVVAASQKRRPRRAMKPAALPNGLVLQYTKVLRDLSRAMDAIIMRALAARDLVRTDAVEAEIPTDAEIRRLTAAIARQLNAVVSRASITAAINKVANRAVDFSRTEWRKQLQASLGIDLSAEPDLAPLIDQFRDRNVKLIRSLAEDKVERVKTVLADAGPGTRVEQITDRIAEQADVTESRAALIARTEVSTVNSQLMQARHEAAGITEFIWRTSQDERVRPSHREMEGRHCSYANPPSVDGEPTIAGQAPNCRCTCEPLLPGIDE